MNTLFETNKAPENRPSQKEIHIPTIHFQVRTASFRDGTCFEDVFFLLGGSSHPVSG